MIDKNKQYTTRSGLPVEIYATDRGGKYPVHGAILKDGVWTNCSWTCEGRYCINLNDDSNCDLIEVTPRIKQTAWVNVYDNYCNYHASREAADRRAVLGRRACIKIEIDCKEGEGL